MAKGDAPANPLNVLVYSNTPAGRAQVVEALREYVLQGRDFAVSSTHKDIAVSVTGPNT